MAGEIGLAGFGHDVCDPAMDQRRALLARARCEPARRAEQGLDRARIAIELPLRICAQCVRHHCLISGPSPSARLEAMTRMRESLAPIAAEQAHRGFLGQIGSKHRRRRASAHRLGRGVAAFGPGEIALVGVEEAMAAQSIDIGLVVGATHLVRDLRQHAPEQCVRFVIAARGEERLRQLDLDLRDEARLAQFGGRAQRGGQMDDRLLALAQAISDRADPIFAADERRGVAQRLQPLRHLAQHRQLIRRGIDDAGQAVFVDERPDLIRERTLVALGGDGLERRAIMGLGAVQRSR
jgi:hypothetical protein